MKHCVITHRHFKAVMAEIMTLAKAGYQSRWRCKKVGNQWEATSTTPIAYSVEQLQRAVA
ncbi:hypothetical protein [Endozoicomonas ascidiicola]|uniref:hypothetical protein n=1 Tax=Endozoicomonas ascidiicola TaxID=1698521 RepID=UPI00082AF473|nr:hypothetical protein [Endozoicomonas ascidiicola]